MFETDEPGMANEAACYEMVPWGLMQQLGLVPTPGQGGKYALHGVASSQLRIWIFQGSVGTSNAA